MDTDAAGSNCHRPRSRLPRREPLPSAGGPPLDASARPSPPMRVSPAGQCGGGGEFGRVTSVTPAPPWCTVGTERDAQQRGCRRKDMHVAAPTAGVAALQRGGAPNVDTVMDAHAGSGDTKPRGKVQGGNRSPSGSTRRDGCGRYGGCNRRVTDALRQPRPQPEVQARAPASASISGRSEKSLPPTAVDDEKWHRLFSTPSCHVQQTIAVELRIFLVFAWENPRTTHYILES